MTAALLAAVIVGSLMVIGATVIAFRLVDDRHPGYALAAIIVLGYFAAVLVGNAA